MWYWYISGVISTLLFISALLNVGLITGFVKWYTPKPKPTKTVVRKHSFYDWANSDLSERFDRTFNEDGTYNPKKSTNA